MKGRLTHIVNGILAEDKPLLDCDAAKEQSVPARQPDVSDVAVTHVSGYDAQLQNGSTGVSSTLRLFQVVTRIDTIRPPLPFTIQQSALLECADRLTYLALREV